MKYIINVSSGFSFDTFIVFLIVIILYKGDSFMNHIQESGKTMNTRMIVEAAMAIAISYILHYIVLFQMPQGGAIKAANLVPLLIFSYRWGGKAGILASVTYGLITFILGFKFSLHIMSIVLDYLVAYGIVGVAGFFKDNTRGLVMGSILACFLKWCASVVSGAVIFASYAPAGENPWMYSMIYNASYMLPDAVINIIVLLIVYNSIKKGLRRVS